MVDAMRRNALLLALLLSLFTLLCAQDIINETSNSSGGMVTVTTTSIASPWTPDSIICQFVVEYVRTPVFLILFVILIAGVAVISGAAFPQWRNYGAQMVLGPIAAAILYIVGTSALRFLLGTSVCGL